MKKAPPIRKQNSPPTQKELDQAIKDFQKRGGQVQRIEPLWIEDAHFPDPPAK